MEQKYIYYIAGGLILALIIYLIFKPSNSSKNTDKYVNSIYYWNEEDKKEFPQLFVANFNLNSIPKNIDIVANELSNSYNYDYIKNFIFSKNMIETINLNNIRDIIKFTEIVTRNLDIYKWNNVTNDQIKNNFPNCDVNLFRKTASEKNYNYLLCIVLFTLIKYIKNQNKNINDYDIIVKKFISDMKKCVLSN